MRTPPVPTAVWTSARSHQTTPARRGAPAQPLARETLLVGSVAALLAAAALVPDAPVVPADAELVRLLRTTTVTKGMLLALGLWALVWRFRRPVPPALALAYPGTAWTAAAALGAMWRLAAPVAAAVALHGAGLVLIVLASRDRDFFPASTTPR